MEMEMELQTHPKQHQHHTKLGKVQDVFHIADPTQSPRSQGNACHQEPMNLDSSVTRPKGFCQRINRMRSSAERHGDYRRSGTNCC